MKLIILNVLKKNLRLVKYKLIVLKLIYIHLKKTIIYLN